MRRLENRDPFTTNEIFRLLCFEYKAVSVEYFMDEMDWNECIWVLKNLAYTDRNLWETTRLKIFTTTSMFSKSRMELTDILTFPWEEGKTNEPTTPAMTDEQRKMMENSIAELLNQRK